MSGHPPPDPEEELELVADVGPDAELEVDADPEPEVDAETDAVDALDDAPPEPSGASPSSLHPRAEARTKPRTNRREAMSRS